MVETHANPNEGLVGVSSVDIDDDGDLDLLLTGRGLPNRVYRNDGTGQFVDGSRSTNINTPIDHRSTSARLIWSSGLLSSPKRRMRLIESCGLLW